MARIVRIADITPKAGEWPNLLDATIPGAPNAQVARVVASYKDRQHRIAIIFPEPGRVFDRAAVVDAVRTHVGDIYLGLVENNELGVVRLWIADPSQGDLAFLASAASAVLRCTWGWDESPSITVSTGNQNFRFVVQYNGDGTHDATEQTAA